MITVLACDGCFNVIRVMGDDLTTNRLIHKHLLWKDGWPCTNCSEKMHLVPQEEVQGVYSAAAASLIRVQELSSEDAFKALCKFGLPSELKPVAVEVVESLLLAHQITGVKLKKSPSERTIIECITLKNGVSLHLASSPFGATVFRITRSSDGSEDGDTIGVLTDSK